MKLCHSPTNNNCILNKIIFSLYDYSKMIFKSFHLRVHKLFIVFLFLIFISTLLLRFISGYLNGFDIHAQLQESTIELEDILNASVKPEMGQNVFFIDTIRMKKRKKERPMTSREACAIESAGDCTNNYLT